MSMGARLIQSSERAVAAVPGSPPAVWAAFVRASAWKSWVLLLQLAVILLLVLALIGALRRPPDVVLVAPDGSSTYVPATMASEALARFVAEQKQRPSDLTVHHFVRDFLRTFLAVNSSTADAAWRESLSRMTPALRKRMETEARGQRLLETLKAAQVQSEVELEEVSIAQKLESAVTVRAAVTRRKHKLSDGQEAGTDRLVVELALLVVPRSAEFPDGLRVAEYRNRLAQEKLEQP